MNRFSIVRSPTVGQEEPERTPETRDSRQFSKRFSCIPEEVLFDQRLNVEHLRVYGAIASSVPWWRNTSNIGQRLIARLMKASQATVSRRVEDLIRFGHIKLKPDKTGRRACYEMASLVFPSGGCGVSKAGRNMASRVRQERAGSQLSPEIRKARA